MEFCYFCLFTIIFGLIETRFDPDGSWPGLASSWSGEEEVDQLGDLTVYRSVPEWISAISTLFLSLSHADLAPAWMTSGCSGATTSTALTPGEPRNTATKCGQVLLKVYALCSFVFPDLGVTCIIPDFFRGESRPQPPPSWHDTLL